MRCINCNKEFVIKRNIKNIFKLKEEYFCNECAKRYMLKINFSNIPLNNFELEIVSLTDKKNFNYLMYEEYYEKIYQYLVKRRKDAIVIKRKIFKLDDRKISYYEDLSSIENKNIVILCFHFLAY